MSKIGIDLLWLKPRKVAGIASMAKSLLEGFLKYGSDKHVFYLFVTKDNKYEFEFLEQVSKFKFIECPILSHKIIKRHIWKAMHFDYIAKKHGLDLVFVPNYEKAYFSNSKIPYVSVIHDLQPLHYPQYHSFLRRIWIRLNVKKSLQTSSRVVAISNFVKKDVIDNFEIDEENISVIHNPVYIKNEFVNWKDVKKKYNIEQRYYYTVSTLWPHKNLKTLLYLLQKIKNSDYNVPRNLIISGVTSKRAVNETKDLANNLGIFENILLTDFVSNAERNILYKKSDIFLFPSIFEGFGMPPIEAMYFGKPVITTKCGAIPEVTQGKAIYVNDPYSIDEWFDKILYVYSLKLNAPERLNVYSLKDITIKYMSLIENALI